jgi:hypothetical protein
MTVVRATGVVLIAGALAAGLVACGQSAAEKQAEETKKAIEQAAKNAEQAGKSAGQAAEQATKGLEQFAKGLETMAGALGGAKAVEPVSFKELYTVFVPFDGWEMGKPTGEKLTSPFAYSHAKVTYRKDDARIEATVTDSGFNQLLIAPFSIFLASGYEKETEDGYEKSVKVAGHPGWEKWDGGGKDGELNAFVNKRFLVQFEGDHLTDTKVLYQLAEASNLAKLVAMK